MLKNIQNFPWRNIFIIFISVIFIHHTYYAPFLDEDCKNIMSPSIENEEHKPWWPSHCNLRNFTNTSILQCLERRSKPKMKFSLAVMGDSHMGALVIRLLEMLGRRGGAFEKSSPRFENQQIMYSKKYGLEIQMFKLFLFDDSFDEIFRYWEEISFTPDLIVIDCNLHPVMIFHGSNEALHDFRKNLTSQLMRLNKLAMKSPVLWYVQPPLSTPRESLKLNNYNVDRFNAMVIKVLRDQRVHLWTSPRRIGFGELQQYDNDVHLPAHQVINVVKIMLNYLCNSFTNDLADNFCCTKREGLVLTYFNKYSTFIVCCTVILVLISSFKQNISLRTVVFSSPFVPKAKRNESNLFHMVIWFLLKSGVCFSIIYFCARTPIIPREEKRLEIPFITAAIVPLLFIICSNEASESQDFIHILRVETKGVLISCLIFLDMSVKWSIKSASQFESLIESSLLILSGIETFHEFGKKDSTGLQCFLKNILPLNLMLGILNWLLDENYEFYGLISVYVISFLIFYFPLFIPLYMTKETPLKNLMFQGLKTIAILFVMTSTIHYWEHGFLSLSVLSGFFTNQDGLHGIAVEQWKRNKYCFGIGILCGIITEIFQLTLYPKIQQSFRRKKKSFIIFISLFLGILITTLLCLILGDITHEGSKGIFLVLVILTIASYLLLNLLFNVKQVYCYAFYWIGNSWLQIYILHFHTLLAFNGTTLLQLIPFPSFVNDILLLFLTVFVASEIQSVLSLDINKIDI